MDLCIIISALFFLHSSRPRPHRYLYVDVGVFAADHETDLARWIGRDGGVRILSHGKDLIALLLEPRDQRQMQPLVFSYINESATSQ